MNIFNLDEEEFFWNNVNFDETGERLEQTIIYDINNNRLIVWEHNTNDCLSTQMWNSNILLVTLGGDELSNPASLYDKMFNEEFDNIKKQIRDKCLDYCPIDEFIELKLLVEKKYGSQSKYKELLNDNYWKENIVEDVVEDVLYHGVPMGTVVDESYLERVCRDLYDLFCYNTYDEKLLELGQLLLNCNVLGALNLLKKGGI